MDAMHKALSGSEFEQSVPQIYPALAQHQRDEAWAGRGIITELQDWAGRFIVAFKLEIPHVVQCVDHLPRTRYGHFRQGHNGFGLRGEIAVNARYLGQGGAKLEVLGTLLHELLHAWQQAHGTPGKRNHHNAQFRAKALELGLIIDRRGLSGYAADSRLKTFYSGLASSFRTMRWCRRARRPRGDSKLKKWSCGCTNVRVAVADFRAMCLKCGDEFRRESAASRGGETDVRSNGAANVNEVPLVPMTGVGHRPN
jgi:hypothetical protein